MGIGGGVIASLGRVRPDLEPYLWRLEAVSMTTVMLELIANLELRVRLFSFELFGKQNELGLVPFTDLGRVFADYGSLSALDGSGWGLKVALGGGLRLRAGKRFVLRTDVAASPGEGSTGAYLTAGHMF